METIEIGQLTAGTAHIQFGAGERDPALDLASTAHIDALLKRTKVAGTASVCLPDIRTTRSVTTA